MLQNIERHIIYSHQSVRDALIKLEDMKTDPILLVVDKDLKLLG